jgi:hypothetical protein
MRNPLRSTFLRFGLMTALAIPATSAFAQYESSTGTGDLLPAIGQHEVAPGVTPHNTVSSPEALWDIQFGYNATTTSGTGGFAGACFFNNEFWVSRWGSDSLFRYSQAGALLNRFTIPGLTGVRALTTDGIMLYAATNSTTIYRIDPTTSLLAPPHTVVAAGSPQWRRRRLLRRQLQHGHLGCVPHGCHLELHPGRNSRPDRHVRLCL